MTVTAHIESRDPFVFMACARQALAMSPTCKQFTVHVLGGPRASRPLLLHAAASSEGEREWHASGDGALVFCMETSSPVAAAEGKAEPFRRLSIRAATPGDVDAFVTEAIRRHREEVRSHRTSSREGEEGTAFLTWNDDVGGWERVRLSRPRDSTTVFLPAGVLEECIEDVSHFVAKASTYEQLHIAPIRIYLLHGVPGSGKTTTVHAIASALGRDVACMPFGRGTTDVDVKNALAALPEEAVLCIEDADALFGQDRAARDHCASFATFLAALDGADVTAPAAVILTTNHATILDPAVRRRVDYAVEFRHASKAQCQSMYERFFPPPTHTAFAEVWERVLQPRRPFPTSALHKYLVKSLHTGDPLSPGCIAAFETLASLCSDTSKSVYT